MFTCIFLREKHIKSPAIEHGKKIKCFCGQTQHQRIACENQQKINSIAFDFFSLIVLTEKVMVLGNIHKKTNLLFIKSSTVLSNFLLNILENAHFVLSLL